MAAEMVGMEHGDLRGCSAMNITSLFYEAVFRQSRKYESLWFLANKRIELAELTLEKLRVIKISNRVGSNDTAV